MPRGHLATAHKTVLGEEKIKKSKDFVHQGASWGPGGWRESTGLAHRTGTLTSHDIPEVDETVSPSSSQEATVGAKKNSIDLREVGILWKKGEVDAPGTCHAGLFVHAHRISLMHAYTHQRVSSPLHRPLQPPTTTLPSTPPTDLLVSQPPVSPSPVHTLIIKD